MLVRFTVYFFQCVHVYYFEYIKYSSITIFSIYTYSINSKFTIQQRIHVTVLNYLELFPTFYFIEYIKRIQNWNVLRLKNHLNYKTRCCVTRFRILRLNKLFLWWNAFSWKGSAIGSDVSERVAKETRPLFVSSIIQLWGFFFIFFHCPNRHFYNFLAF